MLVVILRRAGAGNEPLWNKPVASPKGRAEDGVYSKEAAGLLYDISAHSVAVEPFLSGP
jgi:hypothetical protein